MTQHYTAALTLKSHEPDGFFKGYASVFHLKDGHGDIIAPNAFKKSLDKWRQHNSMPKLLWQHDQTQPIGAIHELYEDEYGLFVKGQLLLELSQAKEAYALLKAGVIDGMSIGFRPLKTKRRGQDKYIEEIDLQEISLVTFAANQQAKVTSVKKAEGVKEQLFSSLSATPITKGEDTMTHDLHETLNTLTISVAHLKETQEKQAMMLDKYVEKSMQKREITAQRPMLSDPHTIKSTSFGNFVRKGIEDLSQKSLSGQTEAGGGYLIPSPIVHLIQQNISSLSVIRQLASHTVINSDTLDLLLEKKEAEVGWVSEIAEREETTAPELARVRIPVHQIYAKPMVSQKLLDDAAINIDEWISKKIADQFLQAENKAFLLGDGNGKPQGLLKGETCSLDQAEWGKVPTLKTGVNNGFANSDQLLEVIYSLKSKYLPGSVWIMSRAMAFKIAKMKDKQDQYLWNRSLNAQQPDTLLGYPVYLCDEMAAEGEGPHIVFGNIKEAYHVVDRAHMSMLRDPFSSKPYVEFYATKRVGGNIVNTQALRYITLSE